MENNLAVPQKLKRRTTYDLVSPLLDIEAKELKAESLR